MPRNIPQTEEDFLAMQQEAIQRVRQMQRRARRTLEDAGMHIEPPASEPAAEALPQTNAVDAPTRPEPPFRAGTEAVPGGFYGSPPQTVREPPPQPDPPMPERPVARAVPPGPAPFPNLPKTIFNLSIDNEQLIILGLLLLLYQDKADSLLILALVYILL